MMGRNSPVGVVRVRAVDEQVDPFTKSTTASARAISSRSRAARASSNSSLTSRGVPLAGEVVDHVPAASEQVGDAALVGGMDIGPVRGSAVADDGRVIVGYD